MDGNRQTCARRFVMPTYEFKCKDCGEDFEVVCHMSEREEKMVCPKCGSRDVTSVLTAAFGSPTPKKF
jgi:putative FmdB family regulatory protein